MTGQSGRVVCLDYEEPECGTYNGVRYCVSDDDEPGCEDASNGTTLCHEDENSDPPPDAPDGPDLDDNPDPPEDEWEHPDENNNPHPIGGYPPLDPGEGEGTPDGGEEDQGGDSTFPGDENGDGECDQTVEDCGPGSPNNYGDHPDLPTEDVLSGGGESWGSGMASGGSCPAPVTFSWLGQTYAIPYDAFCELAVLVRPLVLAGGYLSAALILIGGVRR
ncbi:hypothetical protein H0Z60_12905 [Ectothiorhodospiraceae bacterium WFHF3C12]|nr:hypothetical protein [Ectothiorhodospiraceae bacterium WFHF3C12]